MIIEVPGYRQMDQPPEGYIPYVVQPGDTLFRISRRFNIDLDRLVAQDPQIVHPDLIWPGQIIYLIYLGY
ncbi:MAG: LysM peptidoglycan-binding domain-containing protein [Clostridia bacterium]|nr:MAG: LysM peptidoglycan-binding domain-containing protein [Clostridia bacterium]